MLAKWLSKWVASVASIIICYLVFGEIGILFGVALAAIFIKFL